MRRIRLALAVAGVLVAGHAVAQPRLDQPGSDPEMTAIFQADQGDRADEDHIDWAKVGPRDTARQARVRQLLAGGALHTGTDYWHAAFVFQHAGEPDACLLAHALGVVAAAKGEKGGAWIASAALDRYLQTTGRPQIYGTQFSQKDGGPYVQDPYDRTLISDALRRELGVRTQAEQAEQARELNRPAKP